MTAIQQAPIPVRNSESDHKFAKLDLALDAIRLLKGYRPLSVADLGRASKLRGWLESSATEGEGWLRRAAHEGNLYAMEKLGERLLNGDGLTKSVEEGLEWLKKSAKMGNPFAMEKLADFELDENEATGSRTE